MRPSRLRLLGAAIVAAAALSCGPPPDSSVLRFATDDFEFRVQPDVIPAARDRAHHVHDRREGQEDAGTHRQWRGPHLRDQLRPKDRLERLQVRPRGRHLPGHPHVRHRGRVGDGDPVPSRLHPGPAAHARLAPVREERSRAGSSKRRLPPSSFRPFPPPRSDAPLPSHLAASRCQVLATADAFFPTIGLRAAGSETHRSRTFTGAVGTPEVPSTLRADRPHGRRPLHLRRGAQRSDGREPTRPQHQEVLRPAAHKQVDARHQFAPAY
jgi:hypothetical protein